MEINRRSPPKYRAYCKIKRHQQKHKGSKEGKGKNTHQPRKRQPIPKPRHRRFEITSLEITIQTLTLHRRIHVRPNQRNRAPRDTPTFIADLDRNILFALNDDHFNRGQDLLVFGAVALDDGAEGVFEKLEADVGEVAWDVWECEVFWADELDGGPFEHCVVFFADVAGVFDGFEYDVVDILLGMSVSVGGVRGKKKGRRRTAFVQMMPT